MARRLAALGLRELERNKIGYLENYSGREVAVKELVMIPHGRTPSNERLLFQSHGEGPNATLLPESLVEAAKGAALFLDLYGDRLHDCVFVRSPLLRCAATADVYADVFVKRGYARPDVAVDEGLLEIDHASWHGLTVGEVPSGVERSAAEAYRNGNFHAKPRDGESNIDLLERTQRWLNSLDERSKVVCAFGHGTFQNAAEVLLQTFGERPPEQVFTRKHGESHLVRGYPHSLFPPHGCK
eukprot:CAMPEP_0171788742 /NCGR_PEP_ID=MMETSP0991-20121206/64668_1 /TAXON_ID=483369 /ORGANISM="non described non described, Strain CCMP2098" /LENGTH=240 /DNA_ID=CAMNT_0012397925 /DNA_START=74 /DNA_END=796 /DNA_ORIENTATION=-